MTTDDEVYFIKVGDTAGYIEEQLLQADGEPVDLDGCQVRFHLTGPSGEIDGPAVVADPADGVVRYFWSDGAPDSPGLHLREWEVTFPGGTVLSVPNYQPGYPVLASEELA